MERKLQGSSAKKSFSRVKSSKRPGCIRLFVCPTTGGRLEISVSPRETVPGLKAALARKLRVPPTRITLIYKDKVLNDGCLLDHKIPDESHVTLLPKMESGLNLYNSDRSIMQALENLTENQINEFLSGRAPLMLAIRMGDHMVFVQLQLSTLQSQGQPQGEGERVEQRPGVSPAAATVLSQTGLSASAIAEATRCLSQRLQQHRMQGVGGRQCNPQHTPNDSAHPTNAHLPQELIMRSSPADRTPQSTVCSPLPLRTNCSSTQKTTTDSSPSVSSSSLSSQQSPGCSTAGPTQTLLQLPAHPNIPNIPSVSNSALPSPPPSPGAVIDSMKHVGRGVFTGTFSGTLDASLQDGNGQPRRNVSTILHILNDLLVAAPQSPPASQETSPGSSDIPAAFPFTNLPMTPPSSPRCTKFPAESLPANTENETLRRKMKRVQTMLAQRKEQRQQRREKSRPYPTSKSCLQNLTLSHTAPKNANSSISSTLTSLTTKTAENSHAEGSDGDVASNSSTYCTTNIEQDYVAV